MLLGTIAILRETERPDALRRPSETSEHPGTAQLAATRKRKESHAELRPRPYAVTQRRF